MASPSFGARRPASAGEDASDDAMRGAAPDEARHEAVEAAAHLAASAHLIGTGDPELAAFFTGFTRYASPEDLILYTGAELAALVRLVYARAAERRPGTSRIEILTPSEIDPAFSRRDTLVVAINDDMPFLYDSCTAEVRAQGLHVRAAFHPVMNVARDANGMRVAAGGTPMRESVVVLSLDHIAEADQRARLKEGLGRVFADVRVVVRDWKAMLERLDETVARLRQCPPPIAANELQETLAFLGWLADNHFTFLGCRDYTFDTAGESRLTPDWASGLGVLADPDMRVVRRGTDRVSLTPEVREFLTQPSPLIITKANVRSNVHRRVHMDYIGVKTFNEKGELTGERRFVGLFTSTAYSQLAADIPLLRRKAEHVIAGSGLPPNSHDGKALTHIIDTYPREELFQIGEDALLATALGILSLGQRPKVRVFLRFDKFDRFVSALVFVPRERYNTRVRARIHALLAHAFDGRMSAAHPMLDEEALARIHYIVARNPGPRPQVDVKELETEIRDAIRTWEDGFNDAMFAEHGEHWGAILARRYAQGFPAAYRDTFTPGEAVDDIARIEALLSGKTPAGDVLAQVYTRTKGPEADPPHILRLKLFVRDDYVPLSDCLPAFENLGLKVVAEDAFMLHPENEAGERQAVALQNFLMERADGGALELAQLKPLLEDAFHAVWIGAAESDGFNRLVTEAEIGWRDATIVRAAAKFLRQAGITFSQAYMEATLAHHPNLALLLVDLFYALHDPEAFASESAREKNAEAIRERIDAGLEEVPSADEDRIVRAFTAVIGAVLRTNFFQWGDDGSIKPALAMKLDSRALDMLPAPRPLVEIFVYAPAVEGVHLRFGRVARGGIRWSDRAEDFRTEILGLVKAQQVKNAVIVPVGAKGGFYVKCMPKAASREQVQQAGIAAYQTFIGALLDLTDNIGPDGAIVPPENVLRHDGDDPYLVVAADKGTASFSDIANAIAIARGFWLGDAFASGGSRGYDHKKMGITARGAWEAVKRHFREMGRDIQNEPFTAIGVGDMSGDVFGNGMLLSEKTRLIAAFDHRHIFFDPDPDPETSWAERKRLFDLPRSSWDDYDKSLISKGGGVVPRSAKEVELTAELKAFTGLARTRATPTEIIRALLTADIDLLFFGGIGTYIKASGESQAAAGDRANDVLRVDGRAVRAAVIGEGANLGVTQLGRIEYAREGGKDRKGGRINTDAIDNSAGVDTSDHEVNLKILMSGPMRRGEIDEATRDTLLRDMTGDIARLVLADNYDQTQAISVAEHSAARDLDAAQRFIRDLERKDALDRTVEQLPDDEAFQVLAREGKGLTRPEIAVLLAYAKLDLFHDVADSALPDDPAFADLMRAYFPPVAVGHFTEELSRHRLRREIVATELVNRTVNLAGPLYAHRLRELSNVPLWHAARAFAMADGAFAFRALKARIDGLDLNVDAAAQTGMIADIAELMRRIGLWFVTQIPASARVSDTIATYGAGAGALKGRYHDLASPLETEAVDARVAGLKDAGVPDDLAQDVGVLPLLAGTPEIVLLSESLGVPVDAAAGAFFAVGAAVGLDRLRALAAAVPAADHWDRLALRRIADDLYAAERRLAADALGRGAKATDRAGGAAAVDAWRNHRAADLGRIDAFLLELEHGGPPSIAKVALANSQVQKLADTP